MKWSWRIGSIFGIQIYVHFTFFLLLSWIAVVYYSERGSLEDALLGILFTLALFFVIVLHELGHATAARFFKISTKDITLLPIGGVARLEKIPEDPIQELIVAIAGPAVNIILALFLYLIMVIVGIPIDAKQPDMIHGNILAQFFWTNIILAGFNLIPAFPMDGGRILRGLLGIKMDFLHATRIAASVGQTIALAFGFIGLFTNPFLILIALFVWFGASQEANLAQVKFTLSKTTISHLMLREFHVLSPTDTLAKAIEITLATQQHDFPVVENNKLVGMLYRADLLMGLMQKGQDAFVEEVMTREFVVVESSDKAEEVFSKLQSIPYATIPVTEKGELVGLLTKENIAEFLMFHTAMTERKTRSFFET
ncbi:protease [Candidatus Methylacidiphilum fumarolicum]|uniref:Zinc metalloprotease n=2 Tax=Candidatus Methylacidiphilum fumarolicum TaxID=591154 RepID=I0JXY5_METFB|nr:site-2 protease family protein [Candidatus Methylacidiphilum fumarolicum]TFE70005.1 protease [Candidatus Methylacidiphilum fumarolicum]TFE76749.1 protease [Candidatus Methylacidiphilum fumarolicum]CAI9086463.1 Zinc metalloprotease [Candidatus Methylacidiphilum fumarolicum]CCG92104.1 Zn-dependent protease fused to CBS domain [Methylacidiphilum fumariolicum SolV]